ncbi:hypothetical protein N9D31_04170, partial [Oligoflexaceae bacterium]|nr:hypothetical protein [Oligoflexaceae bacterium]
MKPTKRFIFGKFVPDNDVITVDQAHDICRESEISRDRLQDYPFDKVRRVMRRLSEAWSDPEYKYRLEAQERLPQESGYSPEMIQKGLSVMAGLLDPDFLQKKVETELRRIPIIEGYQFDRQTNTAKQWQPLGVVLHVLAGNVFTGGVGSWIEGALTRNVTILKMSSSERVFMPLFLSSLLECDPDRVLSGATALIDYRSSQTEVMDVFKQSMDGIVVWGGEQAVRAYRDNLPARTKLIVFGPKLSLSVVTEGAQSENGIEPIAKGLAQELSIWDQNACTAPQICYVQGKKAAYKLAETMSKHMKKMEQEIPSGEIDLNAAVEIRKLRTLYEVNQLEGKGGYWSSGEDLKWSIFVDESVDLNPSPLHRTIRIIPFQSIEDVVDQVRLYRGYVQTVGLECAVDERLSVSRSLAKFGVIRMVSLGQMAGGEIDDPHDGAYDLPQFLNLVLIRSNQKVHRDVEPIDRLNEAERLPVLDSYFRNLVDVARRSSYYSKLISSAETKLKRAIDTLDDIKCLPVLSRALMEEHMPPYGSGLKTM